MKRYLPLSILVVLLSCKKEKYATVTEALTAHSWRNLEHYVNGSNDSLPACLMDNRLQFLPDGVYLNHPEDSLCNSGDTVLVYSWHLAKGEKELFFTSPTYTFYYKINLVSGDRLDMETTVNDKVYRSVLVSY